MKTGDRASRKLERIRDEYGRLHARSEALEAVATAKGLSFGFIKNMFGNLISPVHLIFELIDLGESVTDLSVVNNRLTVTDQYLQVLESVPDALRAESEITYEIWLAMNQGEYDHALWVIDQYK